MLRHRVVVLDQGPAARSAVGAQTRPWIDRDTRWARVEDMSAGLTFKAEAAGSRVRTMVTLREPIDLAPVVNALRFEDRGRVRTLHVVEVRRRPEADYVEAFCAEIA